MRTLLFTSLKENLRKNKLLTAIMLLGVITAVFCISALLGSAAWQFGVFTGKNEYATLTMDVEGELPENFPEQVEAIAPENIANVLYLMPPSDGTSRRMVLGWQGIRQTRWFPHVSGRFFTNEEQEQGAQIAYYSDRFGSTMPSITIDGEDYPVVGFGYILPFNIQHSISSKSQHPVLTRADCEGGDAFDFVILPYKVFLEKYTPTQVLIQFERATERKLEENAARLSAMYPESLISLPDYSSEQANLSLQVGESVKGLLLALLASITIVQLMQEWAGSYREQLKVYYLCGMPRRQCIGLLYFHWFCYYLFCCVIGVGLHSTLRPWLAAMRSEEAPQLIPLLLSLTVQYGFTILLSYRGIRKRINTMEREAG